MVVGEQLLTLAQFQRQVTLMKRVRGERETMRETEREKVGQK